MTDELSAAIDRLYQVFSSYPLQQTDLCLMCHGKDESERVSDRLRTVELRSLTLDDLRYFFADGHWDSSNSGDFRHLLPRLLELFAAYHLGEEILFSGNWTRLSLDLDAYLTLLSFSNADWSSWPEPERTAVDAYFQAFWSALIYRELDALDRFAWLDESLLEEILAMAPDARPYLDRWDAPHWQPTRHLAWFITGDSLDRRVELGGPDHPSAQANLAITREWLARPVIRDRLEHAAIAGAPRSMAWEALLALEVMDRGRKQLRFRSGAWLPDAQSRARAEALGVGLPARPTRAEIRAVDANTLPLLEKAVGLLRNFELAASKAKDTQDLVGTSSSS